MAQKLIVIADPGIDGAFAIALALYDPALDLVGLAACAGNVDGEQATKNVHILIEQLDPPRWPRLGTATAVEYEVDGTRVHGSGGLGGISFPCAQLHHAHPSDKLIIDLVRQYPKDITIVNLGPLTVLASAFDRDPELADMVKRLICVGGTWHEPGNASPVAEFHFFCDPISARQILKSGIPLTLIPLDVAHKLFFSPSELLDLPAPESAACRFLRRIVPFGIGATSNIYGLEGFHLKDVLGIVAVAVPKALTIKPIVVDVETRGELTRGMTVIDNRRLRNAAPNVDLAVDVDVAAVRSYLNSVLELAK